MAERKARFTVRRTPYTAAAKNTLGYDSTDFEVIASTEGEAIRRAKQISSYDASHFSWRITAMSDIAEPRDLEEKR